MALSSRGSNLADGSSSMTIWHVLKDQWHESSNPNGFLSLGVAENTLMHDELVQYIRDNSTKNLVPSALTYGVGTTGSDELRSALAAFFNKYFVPHSPIEAGHICVTNGVSTAIEHLSQVLADPKDVFLLGQPYYGSFISDFELRAEAKVEPVSFGDVDPVSTDALARYEAAIQSCLAKNVRVAGIVLCNPHNPLGRCYSRDTLTELMKLCDRHEIHLISDEIYALSVFQVDQSAQPGQEPFISVLSIPHQGIINPDLLHVVHGMSKDFGANGLRMGCLVSRNKRLHEALLSVAYFSYISSLTDSLATAMFRDDAFVAWYVAENCKRLKANYQKARDWAERHNIPFGRGVNAGFFLWVDLGQVYRRSHDIKDGNIDEVVMDTLLQNRVFLASGKAFGSERQGWFRIIFSHATPYLEEGFRRIEKALKL